MSIVSNGEEEIKKGAVTKEDYGSLWIYATKEVTKLNIDATKTLFPVDRFLFFSSI